MSAVRRAVTLGIRSGAGRGGTRSALPLCGVLLVGLWLLPGSLWADQAEGLRLRVGGVASSLPVRAAFVLPARELEIRLEAGPEEGVSLVARGGRVHAPTPGRWVWRAPEEPGLVPLELRREAPAAVTRLNVFVLVPYEHIRDGHLGEFRMGHYPAHPLRGLGIYRPPEGFVEVTAENAATPLSPHFTLGQFECKQAGGYPRYVALREELLVKLELLLAEVNRRGHPCRTFHVMSGYRTPWYNERLGNVTYSRHLWGGAADIFVDQEPADGLMDDLSGDGRIDEEDAEVLFRIAEGLFGRKWYRWLGGGLAAYESTDSHGPFVHVDARGFVARWNEP